MIKQRELLLSLIHISMKRTISGMIGTGSLAHNRRDFIAENVDPDRVQFNICYRNENLKEDVYKRQMQDTSLGTVELQSCCNSK